MIARNASALIAVIATLALVACGGDDEESTSTATATTEEVSADEYEAEANAVLDPLNGELEGAGAAAANPDSPEAYVTAIEDVQGVVDGAVADLDAITPPENVAAPHDQVISALEEFGSALDPIKDAAESGDEQELTAAALDLAPVLEEFAAEVTEAEAEFAAAGIELNLN
ncbi:MAG: hypothetical protein ACR2OC_04120 [Solirubrobacterales bacterium]